MAKNTPPDPTEMQGAPSEAQRKIAEHQRALAASKAQSKPVGTSDMPPMPSFRDVAATQAGRGDTLPEQAGMMSDDRYAEMVRNGQALGGVGGAYAANQPGGMGRADNPEERKRQTAEGLRALAAANPVNRPEPAGAVTEDDDEGDLEEKKEEEDVKDPLADLGPDVYSSYQVMLQQAQETKLRRDAINARVGEIDIEEALVSQSIRQRIPVHPGKFEIELRALSGTEDSWVKDYAWRETTGSSSDLYYQTRTGLLNLTMALVGVGGSKGIKPLLDHMSEDGSVDEKKAIEKLRFVLRYPMPILMEMSLQYQWFERRIKDALNYDAVKNG